ncbi:MAG: hypothetical protein J0H06_10425 [Actinobacteria bacterium]|nr:hypothetical protein [Actinomycetota bacterium]
MLAIGKLGTGQESYYLEKVAEGAEDYYSALWSRMQSAGGGTRTPETRIMIPQMPSDGGEIAELRKRGIAAGI